MSVVAAGVSARYGQNDVLASLSVTCRAGQLTAIVGPNGSGKSTLVKAMCGDLPFRGTITINGTDIAAATSWHLAGIRAVLPQASTLAFPFTVLEVVRIGLTSGTGGAQSLRAEAALERVGLSYAAHAFYQELSGGEQQRVQLARVLAQIWHPSERGTPRWLLLDEPVSSLDIAHQLEVMQIVRDFAAAGGGVIAVMHDLNLTGLFADAVVVMSNGKILAAGATQDVMQDQVLSQAYGCALRVGVVPDRPALFVLPHPTAKTMGM